MTPEENVAYWESLLGTVASSASDIADGLAEVFQSRVTYETLRQTSHGYGQFYKATRGRPPAYVTGNLARSIVRRPAFGGIRATASVGATAKYAAIQEFGGFTWPNNNRFMHWTNSAGSWFMKEVYVPKHPYMQPTTDDLIRDGGFTRAAMSAFMTHMAPILR
jgi:phage gpG-like protein